MRTLLSNLTAVLLVIHAMIGCCHHHWHCDSECAETSIFPHFAVTCQCGDPCCGPLDQSDLPPQPCNGELECQGVCTYLPTQKIEVDASTACADFDFAALIPTLLNGHLSAAELSWDRVHKLNDSPPPLRLHLLNQILLI